MQSRKWIRRLGMRMMFVVTLIVPLLVGGAGIAAAAPASVGAVYTLTNATTGNAVQVFDRAADGSLTAAGTFATGGLGTGAGLGSQGALILSRDHRWLFVVNAGSNDFTVFAVSPSGLTWVDKVASDGTDPISLSVHDDLLYVLNAGGDGNIAGFTINSHGHPTLIANSSRPLSGSGVGPAQIAFNPNGTALVVTEKNTNLIDTYTVGADGLTTGPTTHTSSGQTPFGFAFARPGVLVVSEAFGGAAGQAAVSSYHISANQFATVSASVADTQSAACWLAVTNNGQFAYTTNAGSGSISSYSVGGNGSLTLLNSQAGLTGDSSHPIDMAFSVGSHYLYALNAGAQTISAFQVSVNGSLAAVSGASGLSSGGAGLAAW